MPPATDGRGPVLRLAAAALFLATAALAQGPAPAPAPPAGRAPAATDPAFEAMRAAFEALPEAERRTLQDALVWTGDTNAAVTGGFGRRTFDALNAARLRLGAADPLAPAARAAILAAGEAARRAARFRVAADPGSGAAIGVPERILPVRAPIPGGTRWQSADGRLTLETRAFPAGGPDLDALFARATAPLPERKVTYKLKRPDFVVVTGETALGRSYVRYAAGPEGVRGFSVSYPAAQAAEIDRLVIAIANSFVPFPAAQPEPPRPAAASPPPAAAAPTWRIVGTGLVVAPGRVLTASAAIETCPAPRIGAAPAGLLRSGRGLALLEASGLPGPRLPGVRAAASEDRVVVAADGAGVSVAPGTGSDAGSEAAAEATVTAPLQPGAAGAPVLDRAGGLVGVVARYPSAPRLIAGVMPPARFGVIPGAAAAAFLAEAGIAVPAAAGGAGAVGSMGAAASAVGGAVVGLTCAR